MTNRFLFAGAVLLLASSLASADCAGQATNELLDCSFELDPVTTNWNLVTGDDFTRDTLNFLGQSAAGRVDALELVLNTLYGGAIRSDCFSLTQANPYGFGAWMMLVGGGGSSPVCQVSLRKHTTGDCSATATADSTGFSALAGSYGLYSFDTADTTGFNSAQLEISCQDDADIEFVVDDAFAGSGLTPVELQRFSID